MSDSQLFEELCRRHPHFKDLVDERRAFYRRKRAELGDKYAEWFWTEHLHVADITDQVMGSPDA